MAVAKDNYPRDGQSQSFVAGFAEVEVDVETGKYHIIDFLAVADVGTVIHPARARRSGARAARCSASATRIGQKWVYDQHYGVPLAKRFHHNKPPTILDVPVEHAMGGAGHSRSGDAGRRARHRRAAGRRRVRRDPERAFGRAGRRDLPARAGHLDMILTSLEAGRPMQDPLTAFVQCRIGCEA